MLDGRRTSRHETGAQTGQGRPAGSRPACGGRHRHGRACPQRAWPCFARNCPSGDPGRAGAGSQAHPAAAAPPHAALRGADRASASLLPAPIEPWFRQPGGHARPLGRRPAHHLAQCGAGARRGPHPRHESGRADRPCGRARRCPRRDRRGDARRHAGGVHGDRHPGQRTDRLCRHQQREGGAHRGPPRRPPESAPGPGGRPDGQPGLTRPRGAVGRVPRRSCARSARDPNRGRSGGARRGRSGRALAGQGVAGQS